MIILENSFNASDGENIFYYEFLPEDNNVKFIMQIAHGMAEHSARYKDFAEFLVNKGAAVYISDHRGHGKNVETPEEYGVWPNKNTWFNIVDDLKLLNDIATKNYPKVPNYILGHSMGSFLLRTFIITYSNELDGIIISGTGTYSSTLLKAGKILTNIDILFKGTAHRSKLIDKMAFGGFNKNYDKPYQWLTRDQEIIDKFIEDPYNGGVMASSFYRSFFSGIIYLNKMENAKKIRKNLPVLFISGSEDPVGNNSKGVMEAIDFYKKTGLEKIDFKIYPDARHEILNETNKKEVYNDIYKWINKTIKKVE